MNKQKLEQWITKRSIQKHEPKNKSHKTFAKSLIIDLNKPINETEKILFTMMTKYN
jgi:hypothetical protein